MSTTACSQLNLAFQTLDEIDVDMRQIKAYFSKIRTRVEEVQRGEYKNIRQAAALELNNVHWKIDALRQKKGRLDCIFHNLEIGI